MLRQAPGSSSNFGLGGFDVTAHGSGPAVRGPSGVGGNVGFGGRGAGGGSNGGFAARGTGSRSAMLASGGGTVAPGTPIKKGAITRNRNSVPESSQPSQPLSRSMSVVEAQQQVPRAKVATFGGGLLMGGRGLPKDLLDEQNREKLNRQLVENTEAKPRNQDEFEVLRRNEREGFYGHRYS